jgi:hypothetical protein
MSNKERCLIQFLCKKFLSLRVDILRHPHQKVVVSVLSIGEQRDKAFSCSGHPAVITEDPQHKGNHEEADTRVCLHAFK